MSWSPAPLQVPRNLSLDLDKHSPAFPPYLPQFLKGKLNLFKLTEKNIDTDAVKCRRDTRCPQPLFVTVAEQRVRWWWITCMLMKKKWLWLSSLYSSWKFQEDLITSPIFCHGLWRGGVTCQYRFFFSLSNARNVSVSVFVPRSRDHQ